MSIFGKIILFFGSLFSFLHPAPVVPHPVLGGTGIIPNVVAYFDTFLSAAMTATQTTLTLNSAKDIAGNVIPPGYYSFVIDQGTQQQEVVEGTVASTSVTALLRGVNPTNPNTTSSALAFAHNRGADIKITDYSVWGHVQRILSGTDSIPNNLFYSSHPSGAVSTTLEDKNYVDTVATSGAANANGITKGVILISPSITSTVTSDSGGALYYVPRSDFVAVSSTATSSIVATDANGKIDPLFINQTAGANYTFLGNTRLQASSTIGVANSTTTVRGNIDFSNATISGLLANLLVDATSTVIDTQGSTATTTLISLTIPANTLKGENLIRGTIYFKRIALSTSGTYIKLNLSYGNNATSTIALSTVGGGYGGAGKASFILGAQAATNLQFSNIEMSAWTQTSPSGIGNNASGSIATTGVTGYVANGLTTYNADGTVAQPLVISTTNGENNGATGVQMNAYVIEKVINQ